ncbi:MAG: YaaR family protein [Synergistaceae bacterium]|jgi:uncharacterized protein YaaR (DUF327 family)|nr:YaaR family protein [Synergistaceae bacterium]
MKVGSLSKLKSGEAASHSGKGAGRGNSVSAAAETARSFAEIEDETEFSAIIAELDALGTSLSKYPSSILLSKYRKLVRMALDRVKDGMRIKREFKWRRTERSMFMVIERAEEALDELGELESALERERERTRVLSLIDEIKGCLLSLLL